MAHMVGFLATRLTAAHADITRGWPIMSVHGLDSGEVIYDGATRSFRIITEEEQLRALELHAVEILPHARVRIDPRLVEIAQSRVRPEQAA